MSIYNDHFLFVHIPKCGGTSVRDYLLAYLPGAVDSLSTAADRGPLPIDSTPLRHISEYTGRPLDSWEKIIIPVRNPYSQIVSHWAYHWSRYAQGGRHVHDSCAALCHTIHQWLLEPNSDFRLWYETAVRQLTTDTTKALQHIRRWGFYEYWVCNERGEMPSNVQLMRCENLSQAFPEAVAKFCGGEYPMVHERTSPHKDNPFLYLGPVAIQMINERFRWIFEQGLYDKVEVTA
jgi:hypothetical protein